MKRILNISVNFDEERFTIAVVYPGQTVTVKQSDLPHGRFV
ncbi:hypothetical protein [Mixta theicola]|nr:hypothetical protein [Mixta theicola]